MAGRNRGKGCAVVVLGARQVPLKPDSVTCNCVAFNKALKPFKLFLQL